MSVKHHVTSDIYEAAALVVYGIELQQVTVDRSKVRAEALFHFKLDDVGNYPFKYRENKLLVDAKGLKEQVVILKKEMFNMLDNNN